jgi:hypothetical protein
MVTKDQKSSNIPSTTYLVIIPVDFAKRDSNSSMNALS